MRRYRLVVCVCALLLLPGCSVRQSLPPLGELIEGETALSGRGSLERRAREIRSVKALLRAKIKRGDESTGVRYAVVVERPGKVRIETLPTSGFYALGLLVVNAQRAIALDTTTREAFQGEADTSLVRRVLGVPVPLTDLLSVVTGRVSPEALAMFIESGDILFHRGDDGAIQVVLGKGAYYLELDERSFLPRRLLLREPYRERVVLEARYAEFRESNGVSFPDKLTLTLPQEGVSLDLTTSSVELNGSVAPELFSVEIPEGYGVTLRPEGMGTEAGD